MNKTAFFLLTLFITFSTFSQDISGEWNGAIKIQGTQLRLVFNITKKDNGYISTMDSPDQGVKGIPTTLTSFENSIVKITLSAAKIDYEGKYQNDSIVGVFKQGGLSFPLNLTKNKSEIKQNTKPQEPLKPYPYYSEDITFENKNAGITLSGTLTLPKKKGKFPTVILISGSGPQNRNSELLGHKPFLVLSDFLTKNGYGVLRFDERGVGESKGEFKGATSEDFANDVEAAIEFLKSRKGIDKNKIGLIGHSEGGLIAPIVASKSKDVAFIILLAGPGIKGDKILSLQYELIAKVSDETEEDIQGHLKIYNRAFEIINSSNNLEQTKSELTTHFKEEIQNIPASEKPEGISEEDFIKLQVNQLANPWMNFFIKFNPETVLVNVKCPVLALYGEKDLQVPPKENLEAIKNALTKGGNVNFVLKELPRLNHLFQECSTGSPYEYPTIEQTFSPTALFEIQKWMDEFLKK